MTFGRADGSCAVRPGVARNVRAASWAGMLPGLHRPWGGAVGNVTVAVGDPGRAAVTLMAIGCRCPGPDVPSCPSH